MRSPFGRARRAVNDRLTAPRAIERVASLGPLPPAPTGIATYHRAVLDGLTRIGFTERLPLDPVWPVRDTDFATVPAYRLGIYHLGNNADFHLPIYRMVWEAPGLIVLHDLSLDDFVRGLMTSGDKLGFVAMREALDAREGMSLPEALANKPLRLKIPPTTQAGQVFRLKGHGMPAVGKTDDHGDLYATVDVELPRSLTPEQRQHFEALQKIEKVERAS